MNIILLFYITPIIGIVLVENDQWVLFTDQARNLTFADLQKRSTLGAIKTDIAKCCESAHFSDQDELSKRLMEAITIH